MLRKIRTILATICILLITLLFVDFTGMLHTWLGWLAKIQFLPAVLALNAGVILFLVVLTLVSGRIYCSVICPLGIFQDIVARIGRRKKKMPYSYSKPKRLPAILHLQKCKNNNPLMESRVWKGQISSTYVSLIPELWA